MSRILVFDTETTGLPKSKFSKPENTNEWPYIVQLSYIIYNVEKMTVEKCFDHIIQIPSTIIINEKCVSIHGISNQISTEQGIPLDICLDSFLDDFRSVDLVIGHNIEFDLNMILAELWRRPRYSSSQIKTILNSTHLFCTMQEGMDLCRIKSLKNYNNSDYKFPNLAELHHYLFGKIPIHLHNSMNDVIICLRCYHKMKYNVDICSENSELEQMVKKLL